MWERFKFWIRGYKDCAGCCLGCSFFEECKADVFSEEDEREAYERDVMIETIISERIPEHRRRKSAQFYGRDSYDFWHKKTLNNSSYVIQ